MLDASVDGILAFDREYRYTAWNRAMERISGVSRADVLGKCVFDVFPFLKETAMTNTFTKCSPDEQRSLKTVRSPFRRPDARIF